VRLQLDLPHGASLTATDFIAGVGYGLTLRGYRFDHYRTTDKPEDKPQLTTIALDAVDPAAAAAAFASLKAIAAGVALTRDLVSEPANVLNPVTFADLCKSKLSPLGVTVEVLTEAQMQGWGALLGVAQGSAIPPRTVIMRWLGADDPNAAPLAVVGKGVCFDSGGLSLKPPASMEDMKSDMGGAGVVTGLMAAIAGRKAKVNVVGAIGLVENMPSGTAQRPGDIVTSLSGQTIEVLNTDAEGRLVLADVLWHIKETIKPVAMVDLATLTGAVIVSLGSEYAGLFANDNALSDALSASGIKTGEKLWRLPLHDSYDKEINCDLADMKNIGSRGAAGSITAAQFLKRFVGEVPWAHLDIAGVTWTKKDAYTVPKGASGFGVRLLDDWIASHEQG
jgi:leucyl aminopeptidase